MDFTPDEDGLFHSLESGKPFENCASCRLPLVEANPAPVTDDLGIVQELVAPYLVAKSFHKGECVFEYALCDDCRSNMAKELSTESKESLREFFERKMDVRKRSDKLANESSAAGWIKQCATCGRDRETAENYSTAALFHTGSLMLDPYPLCFCGECEEEIQAGLSKETLGVWDDFVESHFDSPPANVKNLPVGGRPLLI